MPSTLNIPNRRVCAIDVGTNSTRYMIADIDRQTRRITVLFQGVQVTRIGAGIDRGEILPESAGKTLEAIEQFFAHAISLAVSDFKIIGTAALREAGNREDFCKKVLEATGFPLEVVEASKEAAITELAIAHSLTLQQTPFCGLDIGGGSVQFIFHHPQKQKGQETSRYQSLSLGAVRMTERFLMADPPTPSQTDSLQNYVRAMLGDHLPADTIGAETWQLVGVGGTITTAAAMVLGLKTYDHGKIHGSIITKTQWESILRRLSAIPASQRIHLPGLQRGREDIIVAGLVVLDAITKHLGAKEVTVSDRGLLYGMLVAYLEEMEQMNT